MKWEADAGDSAAASRIILKGEGIRESKRLPFFRLARARRSRARQSPKDPMPIKQNIFSSSSIDLIGDQHYIVNLI